MCGICGIVCSDRNYQVDKNILLGMRDILTHRGPDDAGLFYARQIGLASRRLAIIDLSLRGRMPMHTPDGRYSIVHNGEVYNFQELRQELEAKGFEFTSQTDTEVVLDLYIQQGVAMLERLNGMFAFAIWDTQESSLFIARDRLGVKPLYYAVEGDKFYFASEEKSLFVGGMPCEFDQEILEELLLFRYVAGERTPFRGVKRLLPGHYLLWKDGQIITRSWWNLSERILAIRGNIHNSPPDWFQQTFDDSVRLRKISDVPLGVLLSGGLDSSSVVASLAIQEKKSFASFTVRFNEKDYDESQYARSVAEYYSLEYHELLLKEANLIDRLREATWYNDEPLVHAGDAHLLAISRYAKSQVSVLLSGEGADETLGGYVRYQLLRYPSLLNLIMPFYPKVTGWKKTNGRIYKLKKFLELGSLDDFVLFNACEILPADLEKLNYQLQGKFLYRQRIMEEARRSYPNDPFRQAMYGDLHTFLCSILDRNDRMTMGASIECRVPFLDYRLVEGLAMLPSSMLVDHWRGKSILRKVARDRLPESVLKHRKWGFGVPWADYFRRLPEFQEIIHSLPTLGPIGTSAFDSHQIAKVVDAFFKGDRRVDALIRTLFNITFWYQTYFQEIRNHIAV
jgi:asparagine synthase (glutamine-hydrolysing)